MEYSTHQQLVPKIEESPFDFDYGNPFPSMNTTNTTSMLEDFLDHHELNSQALALPEDYYQIVPQIGFQGLEDCSNLDFTTTFRAPSHCGYDENPPPTVLESFGDFSNGPSDLGPNEASLMKVGSSGFSSTHCDSVVFDEKPNQEWVGSSDLGHFETSLMMESSAFSSSSFYSVAVDEENLVTTAMVELSCGHLDISEMEILGHHEVSLMIESSGFSSSPCDSVALGEMPISTMVASFDHSNDLAPDLGLDEVSNMIVSSTFSSSQCDALVLYEKPLSTMVESFGYSNNEVSVSESPSWDISHISLKRGTGSNSSSTGRYMSQQMKIKSCNLELEEIKKHFDTPITKAAKELKVGVTLLKRRCRELNILRWPHRKIRSLNSLIEAVKDIGLINEVKLLEENKRLLEQVPNTGLTQRTKKLRQSIFKANYKKRVAMSLLLG